MESNPNNVNYLDILFSAFFLQYFKFLEFFFIHLVKAQIFQNWFFSNHNKTFRRVATVVTFWRKTYSRALSSSWRRCQLFSRKSCMVLPSLGSFCINHSDLKVLCDYSQQLCSNELGTSWRNFAPRSMKVVSASLISLQQPTTNHNKSND